MRRRSSLVALLLLSGAAWYVWHRARTPEPPVVPLDGVSPERREKIESALAATRAKPRSGKAWGELGMTLFANGFFEQSVACFRHAQRFEPNQPRWAYFHGSMLLLHGRREGFEKLRAALATARSPNERQAILFQLALALVEDGQLEEAETHTRALADIQGTESEVSFLSGVLALGRGDRSAARTHLSGLTEHPSARKRVCLLLAGLFEPNDARAKEYRGRAELLPDDAPWPESFERELVAYRAGATNGLAAFARLESEGKHDEALALLREFVATSPDEAACYALGYNLARRGDYDTARHPFEQVIGFNPRNARAYMLLGICHYETGNRLRDSGDARAAEQRYRDAVAAEDKALAIQTDLGSAHLTRGRALKHLGRTADAIEAFRQAVRVGTEFAEMHQALGEALAESGQLREAIEHLENAVKLAKPNDPVPQRALDKWKPKANPKANPKP